MTVNVRKDILFLFAILFFVGPHASSQSDQNQCVLKVFVNDPYAQIFVDNKEVGASPQMIPCSDQEKSIIVRSSDGQIFARLLKAKKDFDLTNSSLNVIFHRKTNFSNYENGVVAKSISAPEISVPAQAPELPRQPVREFSSTPQLQTPAVPSPIVVLKPTKLSGQYIQIFALKNLDLGKIEQDIASHYNGKSLPQEITVCAWQSLNGAQTLSLVLVGPFSRMPSAFEAKSSIGGKSFIVKDPFCKGGFTKVRR